MKLSVSLSEEDVAMLDRYVEQAGLESRSAGIQQAIRRLGDPQLEAAYASACAEWIDTGDEEEWDAIAGDGLAIETR